MSGRKYSFVKGFERTGAPDFSERSASVRETVLENIYPSRIVLPMKQHYGLPAVPAVKPGDRVSIGQCVGAPAEGTFSVPVHSGISGEVTEIKQTVLPNGVKCAAVVIESDRRRTYHPSVRPRVNMNIDAAAVVGIVRNAGIVGMGGEGIPTAAKINRAARYKVRELLVNCLQSEPFATCDLYKVSEFSDSVVKGAAALAGAAGAGKIVFCLPAGRKDELEAVKYAIIRAEKEYPSFIYSTAEFADRFPQGNYRLVAKAYYGTELGDDETLEEKTGAVLFNCSTCAAVWDAVYGNLPLCSRIVTVTGDTMLGHNVLVPIGTPVSEIVDRLPGLFNSQRLVWGNALTGLAINDLDTPIIKTTSAVTVIKKLESPKTHCIHCGLCVSACPVGISPSIIKQLIDRNQYDTAIEENAGKCIACGACSYVCPAGIDLTGTIASFSASGKKENSAYKYNGTTNFSSAALNIGEASLLEYYAEEADTGDTDNSVPEDAIVLPFEGGKIV